MNTNAFDQAAHEDALLQSQPGQITELEAVPQRDYRKECWVAVYAATVHAGLSSWAEPYADDALLAFDKRFPA